jgi:predicted dehydrogenase
VERVTGYQENLVVQKGGDFTIEDCFNLSMKYQNGILQNHTHTWSYPDVFTQIELISDQLHLTLDLVKGSVTGKMEGEFISFQSEENELYQLELAAFAKAIEEKNPELVLSNYKDSIQSLSVALKAMEALEVSAKITR